MENIRSVIKERIKSCISCNVEQCPVIKQRLDQHVLSHHSSAQVHQIQSQLQASERKFSIVMLEGSTSTSDLSLDKLKNESDSIDYKQNLKTIIFEWSNDIPNIKEDSENVKQNKLNELLEKIYDLFTEINNIPYESNLTKEIDEFLNSTFSKTADEVTMRPLKEKLITKIQELNKKNKNNEDLTPKIQSNTDDNIETKEIAVNTFKSTFEPKVEEPSSKYKDISIQNSLIDSSIKDYVTTGSNKNDTKVYVDNQVQHNLSNVFSVHTSINNNVALQKTYGNEIEGDNAHKRNILDWLLKLNNEEDLNLDQEDTYDDFAEDLFNRLKPILDLKSYPFDKTSLLKEEIFNFTLENLNVSLNSNNIVNLNKLASNLAKSILNEKYSGTQNKYLGKQKYKSVGSHRNDNLNVFRLVNDVVVNALVSNGIYSDRLINNMTESILDNVNSASVYKNEHLNAKLCNFLKHSTGLSDTDIANIINNITEKISHINYKSELIENLNDSWHNNVISVFKSEVDLTGQPNNTNPSTRRKSSIAKNRNGKVKAEETNYTNKLSAVIMTWLDGLPVGSGKAKNKKNKQSFVQNLTSDILDHVKLHSIMQDNTEKDKYISFFIYRWLNRFEFFKNIDEAKPFVDQLLKEIADIPEPTSNEANNKGTSFKNDISNNGHKSNSEEEFVSLKEEIINLFNDLSPKSIIIKDKIKRNKVIEDLVLQVQNLVTERRSQNEISNVIDKNIRQIINSDQKQIITRVNKDITDKIQKILQNVNLDNINNKMEVSETILKHYITKYLDHRFDPEDSIARAAFTQLLKNELDNLSTPKSQRTNNSTMEYQQEEFLIDKLSKELEYINLIIDWLKSLPLEESYINIDNIIFARSINKLAKDINQIEENLLNIPSEVDRNKYFASIIEIFLEQLPISQQYRNNVDLTIDDLINKIKNVKLSQGTCCQLPDCQPPASIGNETERDISNFIEDYIRNNSDEISEDDLKLEACILRFFDELDQKEAEHVELSKSQLNNKNGNKELQNNETARRFSFELGYANEISQWLKNLPLKPLKDEQSRTQVGNMVSSLAEKVCKEQMENNSDQIDNDLTDYINNWIMELPLDPSKNINLAVAVQQLLHRLERVDAEKYLLHSNKEKQAMNNVLMISKSQSCCGKQQDNYPGSSITDEIEDWCNNLPVQSENENANNKLRQNVATKLYQKIRELNMNSEYCGDDLLYREVLNEEIKELLNDLPQNSKLQSLKDVLRKQLLDAIMEKRNEIKEMASAIEYRHDLEKTIDMSMPHPVQKYLKESPGFKIYKERLAAIFILQNFDHGNDASKLNYEKRLKMEIDKYFKDVQLRNSTPLSQDQVYNELYSALFSVPLPNEYSIIEEVEEIKTRCEIDNWFETLPLKEPAGVGELLEWDQILAVLAKRLHEMEKNDCGRDIKMHKEITKWLMKLPLLRGQENNIDDFAQDLQRRLKATQQNRECSSRYVNASHEMKLNNSSENQGKCNNIQVANNYNDKDTSTTPLPDSLPACCQSPPPPQPTPSSQDSKNLADVIIKIVETWCQSLPLPAKTSQDRDNIKVMKEHIAVKIIMKISEMNMNPEIFEDDFLYNGLLEDELDNQLEKLPDNCQFNKSDAKNQLINAIETVKPLVKEEKLRYEYKHEVKNTIDNILNAPQDKNSKTTSALASLRDEIADDFIVYEFHKQDYEESQIKDKIYKNVQRFLKLINERESEETSFKPLIVTNQLICELRKVSVPNEFVIIEELKEIEMKFEIAKFFDEISLADDMEDTDKLSSKIQLKSTLAKRLSDFEKIGYTEETCYKIKKEVIKYIKKIDDNLDTQKVDEFVETLQKTYPRRMSISQTSPEINDNNKYKKVDKSTEKGKANFSNAHTDSKQWHSLLPATPKGQNMREGDQDTFNTLNDSSTSYRTFESGRKMSSSRRKSIDQSKGKQKASNSRYLYNNDQNNPRPSPNTSSPKSPYLSNIPQRQVSEFSGISDSKRTQDQYTQNRKMIDSTEYPGCSQQYPRYQDMEEKFTNTSRNFYQNDIQPNRFSQYNQSKDSSFTQVPAMGQGTNEEAYKHSLDRPVPAARNEWASPYDMRAQPTRQPSHRDMSVSCQDLENPDSCVSKSRRTCKKTAITIFSPSYLEPEIDECQERKDKSKIRDEEKIECKCGKYEEDKILCKCGKDEDEKIYCKCGKKESAKASCSLYRRRYCKFCNRIHPFNCGMYNYPNCYY